MSGRCLVTVCLALALGSGCDDDADPVDIPFEGIEVSGDPNRPPPPPPPPPPASSSATSSSATPQVPVPAGGKGGDIAGCCAALQAAAAQAKDSGTRAMNAQAASVCARKVQLVRDGKMKRGDALAQVRSSLLGAAPAACR